MQANSNAGTDLTAYAMPDDDDFVSQQPSKRKKYWRIGGRNPDYPGMHDFIIRPLPVPQGRRPTVKVQRHFYQLPTGQWFALLCPLAMGQGNKCLSCEQIKGLLTANPLDVEIAEKMAAKEVTLINCVIRSDEARGPVIHEAHWSFDVLFKKVKSQGVNVFDPTAAGRDLELHTPAAKGDRWGYTPRLMASALSPDPEQIRMWIDAAHPLEAETVCLSYDKQREAYTKLVDNASFPPAGSAQTVHAQAGGYNPPRQVASRTLPPRPAYDPSEPV